MRGDEQKLWRTIPGIPHAPGQAFPVVMVSDSNNPAAAHMTLPHFSSRLILSDPSFLWEQGETSWADGTKHRLCLHYLRQIPSPRQLTRPRGRLWPPPTKMSAKSHLDQGCSVNKPPPSTSASHRQQLQPKSIDEKQSVISRPHWLGYGWVKKHYRKHRCGEITSSSGAFLSLQVLPDLPQNFHVHTQNHLVYLVAVPVPVQVCCVTLGRARPAWHKQQRPSSPRAAGSLVSPRRKVFQLFQIPPTRTQSPCFVIKTRRKSHPKEFYLFPPSTYSTEVIFFKKTTPPKLATRTTKQPRC